MIALLATSAALGGCGEPAGEVSAHRAASGTAPAPTPSSAPASSPALNEQQVFWLNFKARIRETPWTQIDRAYIQVAQAIPFERASQYGDYVRQTQDADANVRANGYIGMVATNAKAAPNRLARALESEQDPYNRTIIVWCLRYTRDAGGDRGGSPLSVKAAVALWDFVGRARDVDFGLCLDAQGRVVTYRSPFPLAGVEALKALVDLRGVETMLEGPGWQHLMDRLSKHIDPAPLQLDMERFNPDAKPRETDQQRAERLMRELDEPQP
jgi:hypothetical protein